MILSLHSTGNFIGRRDLKNDEYATNYYLCYESDTSAFLGTLLDLYSVFPEDQASDIILAKEPFLNMVCVYYMIVS